MNTQFVRRIAPRLAAPLLALWIAACGSDGGTPAETPATPSPPTNPAPAPAPTINAAGASDRAVTLGWTATAGATGWRLERRHGAGGAYAPLAELPATPRQYFDEGLQSDTAYDYRITALGVNATPGTASARTGTAADAPLTSLPATAGETLAEAQIGPAGGRLQSADGSIAVDWPANAFATPTAVRLRRLSNTLAPLLETAGAEGVAIEVDAAPQQPPVLTLGWQADEDDDGPMIQAALQRADGSWLLLPPASRDLVQRRFTTPLLGGAATAQRAGLSTAVTAAAARRYDIVRVVETTLKPQRAATPVSTTLEFKPWSVVMARETECMDDPDLGCLPVPVLGPRTLPILNQKPGYERSWAVQGVIGGDAFHGSVVPNPGHGAIYTAPAVKPSTNPVTLSFSSRHLASGRRATLRTTVRITEPQWTGATHGLLEADEGTLAFHFGLSSGTWRLMSSTPTEERYEIEGVQRIDVENRGCVGSASPTQSQMPTGVLIVNRASSPPSYTLDVGSEWMTAITGTCPDGTGTVPMRVPGRLQASGTLSADGRRIEGQQNFGQLRWEWFLALGD